MKKEFDAVKSMREIRERLNKDYSKDPKLRKERLKKIHSEHGIINQKKSDIPKVSEEIKDNLYQTEKSFDSVKFFRDVKEKIAEETAGMSFEEMKKYLSRELEENKPAGKENKSNKKI